MLSCYSFSAAQLFAQPANAACTLFLSMVYRYLHVAKYPHRLCMTCLENGSGKVLACGVCELPLASKQQVFSVPGAEGVTGAYVNPYG